MASRAKLSDQIKPVMRTRYAEIQSYITKDGSIIRELVHPNAHGSKNQSLAEAIVAPGGATLLHRHHRAEEIYHVVEGIGVMTLGTDSFEMTAGDSVCIPPGMPHCIRNVGTGELKLLCCCAPPYSHDDTELLTP